jgi:hypothetical protein
LLSKALKQTLRAHLRACSEINESKQTPVVNSSFQRAAEFPGVAGEFRCQSLHSSQILNQVKSTQLHGYS